MLIVGMLDALVLLDGRGISQNGAITAILQTVDQPIPIEGGLNRNRVNPLAIRPERQLNLLQVTSDLLVEEPLSIAVHKGEHQIIAMQVYSCHNIFHRVSFWLLFEIGRASCR